MFLYIKFILRLILEGPAMLQDDNYSENSKKIIGQTVISASNFAEKQKKEADLAIKKQKIWNELNIFINKSWHFHIIDLLQRETLFFNEAKSEDELLNQTLREVETIAKQKIEDGEVKHEKGKSFNGNASVLDPVACEVILRFFMPTKGQRVYNPFGGGVQFGFVTGSYGYEYVASEIRKNQCDANNEICKDFGCCKWVKSDSSTYVPKGKFDLAFSCPPYYQVEEYLDYDGKAPEGELNSIPTYEKFRDTLFSGYKKGIEALNDNCFFVVMTGDSRNKDGGYYGCEAEHELFFRDQGLHIYNKIVYLECEFTRLAHAKVTLNYRKFPKREQKILVFYNGDIQKISELYPKIGRL